MDDMRPGQAATGVPRRAGSWGSENPGKKDEPSAKEGEGDSE